MHKIGNVAEDVGIYWQVHRRLGLNCLFLFTYFKTLKKN